MRKNHKGRSSSFLSAISVIALLLVACPPVYKGSTYKHSPKNKTELLAAIQAEITAQKTPSPNLNNIDTSRITDMRGLFQSNATFNGGISGWNTGRVVHMDFMFYGATAFNQDISSWDVSKVTSMTFMFLDATNFNKDLTPWGKRLLENILKTDAFKNSGVTTLPVWYKKPNNPAVQWFELYHKNGSIITAGENPKEKR